MVKLETKNLNFMEVIGKKVRNKDTGEEMVVNSVGEGIHVTLVEENKRSSWIGFLVGSPRSEGWEIVEEKKEFDIQNIDAKLWAEEFVKTVKAHPNIPTDKGTMIGWFANAIMAGYDHEKPKEELKEKQTLSDMIMKNPTHHEILKPCHVKETLENIKSRIVNIKFPASPSSIINIIDEEVGKRLI